jgi:multicomponent Na+:H+ antiporter subunit B
MNRSARTVVFLAGAGGLAALVMLAIVVLPAFGSSRHPYRTAAVHASVAHNSANVVSSVNFDQRGFDTLGEETILLGSVIGAATLLRTAKDETEVRELVGGRVLESTALFGYLMIPIATVIGLDVITHGHLTPGGGFQGGVVVGTGVHFLYLAGQYRSLERVRPVRVVEWGETIGTAAFACLGLAGIVVTSAFLANIVAMGGPQAFGQLFSAGTVPLLNGAVGIEVASGTIVLLAKFLEQAIVVKGERG